MAPRVPTYLSILLAVYDAAPISAFAPVSGPQATIDVKCSSGRPTRQPKKLARRTQLRLSKDNNRARLEKSWEDMMGDDWREFRARLVAQELAEAGVNTNTKQSSTLQSAAAPREEKIGNFFTGAISSIFSSKGESSQKSAKERDSANSIFDGDAVGGATEFSKHEISSSCQDPFLTDEECHIMYDPEVSINKHRWAHPLYHVEPGCILVANEKLGGVFHQTVVLMIDHNENAGSTGMVINRPFNANLMKVASDDSTETNMDLSLKMAFGKAPVGYGGPVMLEQYSTLHGYGEVMGSKKVCPGVFVGGSGQLMQEVRRKNMDPSDILFVKGHAAWIPGQLSREIEKGVWYIASASSDLILRYAGAPISKEDNDSDLWADILTCMGGKFEEVALTHGGRGDARMMP